jgi:hypothetical protein
MIACVCGKPARDAYLCRSCSRRLERALGDLPALLADLDVTLTRQAVTGAHSEGKPTKKDSQPLPLHNGAAAVAFDVRHKLTTSVRHLTEARGIIDLPADNPPAMARWLLLYHDTIRLDPAGPDIASDIHACTTAIMTVIDLPTTRGQFKVGMCPETDEQGTLCPGEVWVHLPAEDLGLLATMECRKCGKVYETWQWLRAGARILKRGSAA